MRTDDEMNRETVLGKRQRMATLLQTTCVYIFLTDDRLQLCLMTVLFVKSCHCSAKSVKVFLRRKVKGILEAS